jgi:transposase
MEFTSREKTTAVLRLLKGESGNALSAELDVSIRRLERWQNEFVSAGTAALARRKDRHSPGLFAKHSGAILQWAGLLAALVILVALLAIFLQRAPGD